ncbi:MAG: hypothetical protein ACI88H_003173 [Cocleimonas sp.]|jgi:hypothetical protein
MFTVLMIYLVVAVVRFFVILIGHIRSPDPDREYSRKDILSECATVAVFWPVVDGVLLLFRVGDWFFLPRSNNKGGTCGFCNAYYYRQMPGYKGTEKVWVKPLKEGEEPEALPMPQWMQSLNQPLDKL